MDTIQASSCENNLKQVLTSKECEPTNFRNNSHSARILEDLQSLRKYVDGYLPSLIINIHNIFLFLEMKFYVILDLKQMMDV